MESEEFKKGRRYAWGVITAVVEVILVFQVVNLLINPVWQYFAPTDSTDKDWWNRSNFELMIDYGTGQEYLKRGDTIIKREAHDQK